MKLDKSMFKDGERIEITNVRNIDIMDDTPSVLEVYFDDLRSCAKVIVWLDGRVIGANERFTFINNWLKKHPAFDTIVDDEVREFEL